jgi:DNA-binding MarR family transcriptional regulator/GNAT superfamily N-acetyltransferase
MSAVSPEEVAAVRRFNRFYTRRIDALGRRHLKTPYSLAEARVLYELAHHAALSARDLVAELGLDQGYLSRILARFEERGLIRRLRAADDARRSRIELTAEGRARFSELERTSEKAVVEMLGGLGTSDRGRALEAMGRLERLFGGPDGERPARFVLRPHRVGDLAFVVHRQAILYAEEYGWNGEYEALAAEIAAQFLRRFDAARERCWIAERDGEIVGSVFLVDAGEGVGKLRLLYVDPAARGVGLGAWLVEECVAHARRVGYGKLTLWTNDVLVAARRIYETAGFRLARSEPHHSFGKDLVGQTWELDLTAPAVAAGAERRVTV